ncbi:uncharacterized protein EDB93DRAFT_888444 [Suillus bovinus]|uniref:uncharacterized protein n=1 Tax=Suillus bovinus TaxID=48563 RepID=UPI001B884A3D|nr:uncharacterized protein EDB93DRAFT_888444 [Suillus bovinus]KAG2133263.1 hypothetical protein EDB93DRAFT_888444 [Suillus bovinus]
MLESRPPCLVQKVDYELKTEAGLLSLAEELRSYILSFLPCRDILRCTSVCKALHQTYMSSSELQYIVELSGQRLLPVPNTNNNTSASSCLQTLRDRAHAWFKFDMYSFKTITLQEISYSKKKFIADGHIYSWDENNDVATIIPILPKPSQRTVERSWSPGTLRSGPNSITMDVLMDPAQNLIAIVYYAAHENDPFGGAVYIDLKTLDGDGVHPQAAGPTLLLSEPSIFVETSTKLKCWGRHIALQRSFCMTPDYGRSRDRKEWKLQIWDWQNSTTSRSVLGDIAVYPSENNIDFCFVGNDRLLVVVGGDLAVYSIEDVSQRPQFLACFRLPFPLSDIQCILPMDHIEQMQMQAQPQTVTHTSDPTHQLLCLNASYNTATVVFIISTTIFFELDEVAATMPKPWRCWGPLNTRIFWYRYQCQVHVSGNRVLQAIMVDKPNTNPVEYKVRLMDFSPMAVTNRQGLGCVVKEPSTIEMSPFMESTTEDNFRITTSLPYVEVVSDRKIGVHELQGIWLDKDRIYLLGSNWDHHVTAYTSYLTWQSSRLEVINI